MKAKLIKLNVGVGYRLDDEKGFLLGSTLRDSKNRLSFKNCEAIELGYDLDELVTSELNKLPYTKHLDDGQYNDGQIAGFELGAYWAFQKALEILGDKKFSEEDLDKAFELGKYVEREDCTENYLAYKQSLQQTEWEVSFNPEEKDSEGCLILKRL